MSVKNIDELSKLFTLPEVSGSAEHILRRETESQQEQNTDEKPASTSGPKVSADQYKGETASKTESDSGGDTGRGLLDSEGVAFDPAIHATDAEGRPKKTKTGRWSKKRGRKSSTGYSQKSTAKTSADVEAEQAGLATAQVIFTLGVGLGGEEWKPVIDDSTGVNEPQQMAQAWAEYYKSVGVTNVPPWLTVVIACSGYALPRLTMPKTQTRLQRFTGWIGKQFKLLKSRKKDNE